jgi:hypothetical protein
MKIHPSTSYIPAAGAVGASVMAWNAGLDDLCNAPGIGTSQLNFMGAQDAILAGSLFIAFAALARGAYLYSRGQNGDARKCFALGGGMLMAAGLYALTVGVFGMSCPGSKIGEFNSMSQSNASLFGVVHSVLALIGAALVGTAYNMSSVNTNHIVINSSNNANLNDDIKVDDKNGKSINV